MKHKTWFRLVVRAIGLAFIGMSLPMFVHACVFMVDQLLQGGMSFSFAVAYLAGSVVEAAFGAYLFFGGEWIVNKVIPSNRPYCPNCGYDLSHNTGERCSECGVTLPLREAPPPT